MAFIIFNLSCVWVGTIVFFICSYTCCFIIVVIHIGVSNKYIKDLILYIVTNVSLNVESVDIRSQIIVFVSPGDWVGTLT